MDDLKSLIAPATGEWGATLIIVLLGVGIWVINKLPGWLASRSATVHGSPSSPKYWRARLSEALAHHDSEMVAAERAQLAARVAEARIMVEAHEAKRRVGIGGVVSLWMLVAVFGLTATFLVTAGAAAKNPMLHWMGVAAAVLMIGAELGALHASSAGKERFNVLVAAGRYGRSDLVREDPWRVLREYDHARQKLNKKKTLSERKAADKAATSRWIRFERSLLGITAYEDGVGIKPSEIWTPPDDAAAGGQPSKAAAEDVAVDNASIPGS